MSDFHPFTLRVTSAEDGMKLMRFLERRLTPPPPAEALHRWIRTGQVRLNKGRVRPFTLVRTDDEVRLPPFAVPSAADERPDAASSVPGAALSRLQEKPVVSEPVAPDPKALGPDLPIVLQTLDYLVLRKPAGLPVHGGTRHRDSVAARLAQAHVSEPYAPAPAHRLDRQTSGLLLAGRTHRAQRFLHDLFQRSEPAHEGGGGSGGLLAKDYLAWARGPWRHPENALLADILEKRQDARGKERMAALSGGGTLALADLPDGGDWARAAFGCALPPGGAMLTLIRVETPWIARESEREYRRHGRESAGGRAKKIALPGDSVLFLLRLITGRTHQIRVQLAARRAPIIGDARYGGPPFPMLLLHAVALRLPAHSGGPDLDILLPPEWPEPWQPEIEAVQQARARLDGKR